MHLPDPLFQHPEAVFDRLAGEPAAYRQVWPAAEGWSVREGALKAGLAAQWEKLERDLKGWIALEKAQAPLIGVTGLLNAGKSSLIASLLSPDGAARVLRGEGDDRGTQRFVFWLPESWRHDPAIYEALREELASVFGAEVELLSDEPAEAHRQYNGSGEVEVRFGVPLLAFDRRLDEFGFGFLDCPDFERRHPGAPGEATARVRLEFVQKAARLMSALVVVVGRAQVAIETLYTFADQELEWSGKPRFLLLNLLRPSQPPEALLKDGGVRDLMHRIGVDALYGAYDFEMDRERKKIPLAAATQAGLESATAPVFFRIAGDAGENRPERIGGDRLVTAALARLDASALWRDRREQRRRSVREGVETLREAIAVRLGEEREMLRTLRNGFLGFLRSCVTSHREELKFSASAIAGQLASVMLEVAPFWARPTLWMGGWVRGVRELVAGTYGQARRFYRRVSQPGEELLEKTRSVRNRLKGAGEGLIHPAELTARSRNARWMPETVNEAELTAAWEEVLARVEAMEAALPDAEVRAFAREVWAAVPLSKKIAFVATGPLVLLGGLVAVCLLPLDLGGSTVVFAASLSELLTTFGLAVTISGMAGEALQQSIDTRVAVPFYFRLLAEGLDVFGLPRALDEPFTDHFSNVGEVSAFLSRQGEPRAEPPLFPLAPGLFLAEEETAFWKPKGGRG
ncbi:MAG TPA: hypothetical protein VNQ90_10530 [Chthoniobacteraceae bacterium]|nr:hypothetical protein [Chthoniobacteraceae bacterium]